MCCISKNFKCPIGNDLSSFVSGIIKTSTFKMITSLSNSNLFLRESMLKIVSTTSLLVSFVMSKKEHFLNKKKCFLFHVERSYSNAMTSSNAST